MKKLKNNSGATILMALLLILLAMAVGAAILTAAVSAAHHMKSDREAQQNYLTVSSAAELIRDSINGQTYERTLTAWRSTTVDPKTGKETVDVGRTLEEKPNLPLPGPMGEWLSACIKNSGDENYLYASLQECSDTITVTVDTGDGGLRPVQAKFSAVPRADSEKQELAYSDIRVELSLAPENGKADDCRMTLTMQGRLTTEGPETLPTDRDYHETCTTKVTWGSPKITKGIKEAGA